MTGLLLLSLTHLTHPSDSPILHHLLYLSTGSLTFFTVSVSFTALHPAPSSPLLRRPSAPSTSPFISSGQAQTVNTYNINSLRNVGGKKATVQDTKPSKRRCVFDKRGRCLQGVNMVCLIARAEGQKRGTEYAGYIHRPAFQCKIQTPQLK